MKELQRVTDGKLEPSLQPTEQSEIMLSVVIPVLDEEETLEDLNHQLELLLSELGLTYEIIFVDDGSRDSSFEILARLHQADAHVRVIQFRKNFGQTAAFMAGFEAARGSLIVTMDADLQNIPEDIPLLLNKMDEGFDIVSGWRYQRQDPLITRRFLSVLANWLISLITGVRLHDYGCSLKAYRREVVENLQLYGEMHRFIPALASWMGVRIAEVKVRHEPRRFGKSKYGLTRITKVILDLLTVKFLLDFSTRPIQIFGLLGAGFSAVGFALGTYLSALKLLYGQDIANRPLLLLAILLMVLGVQLITMGLLGELVVRAFHETHSNRTYMIKRELSRSLDS